MNKSFRQGVFIGVIGPLAFLVGVVYWIFRATRKVPFPVERPEEGAVIIRLVEPEQVPVYWEQWQAELSPVISRLVNTVRELIAQCRSSLASGER